MARLQKVRNFKPYLMRYLHSNNPNYEPVLRDLLNFENEVYDQITASEDAEMQRGQRGAQTWHVVFTALTDILTPFHIEQLFERMERDFSATCQALRETPDQQPIASARQFRPYLMRYLLSNDPNYEPVLRDLLEREGEAYNAITESAETDLQRGERGTHAWRAVHGELSKVVSPEQISQLFNKLEKDFSATCQLFHEMAEAENLIKVEEGGPG